MDSLVGLCLILLILPCALALGVGLAEFGPLSYGGAMHVAPVLLYLLTVFRLGLPYLRAVEMLEADRDWHRAVEIVRQVELAQRFELRGWVPIIPGLLVLAPALWVAILAEQRAAWAVLPFAAIFLVYGLVNLMRGLAHLNEPLLSVGSEGIRTGAYGTFRWADIDGIALTSVSLRGIDFYTLNMRVPGLPELRARMHPFARVVYAFAVGSLRYRLRFRLMATGEKPKVIELVCRTLWERAAGRRSQWVPGNPRVERELRDLENVLQEDSRRVSERAERLAREHGITLPRSALDNHSMGKSADMLERRRPPDNGLRRREVAMISTYRKMTVGAIVIIVGLLVYAFRLLAAATGQG